MVKNIKTFLFVIAGLVLVIFAFGVGIIAVISVLIVLPILRFLLTKKQSKKQPAQERVIDAEYEIIDPDSITNKDV